MPCFSPVTTWRELVSADVASPANGGSHGVGGGRRRVLRSVWRLSDFSGKGDGCDGCALVWRHLKKPGNSDFGALEPNACGHMVECVSGVVVSVDAGIAQVSELGGEKASGFRKYWSGGQ